MRKRIIHNLLDNVCGAVDLSPLLCGEQKNAARSRQSQHVLLAKLAGVARGEASLIVTKSYYIRRCDTDASELRSEEC